jgi:hypothetical protein
MASKKTVATRPARTARKTPSRSKVWMLPVLLLMLIVGSAGLLLAVRESSNGTEAAAPASTSAASKSAPSPSAAPVAAHDAAAAKDEGVKTETARPSGPKPVSITGCVQRTDEGFVLKNTEGSEAPRARSWKSGFMHRGSATVALSDSGDTAHLATHVGQRVSVTGPLLDREMKVLSLRRISASCQ